jgi:hypothetical protein
MVSSIVLKRTVLLVYLAYAAGIVRGALDNETITATDANHPMPHRKILSFPLLPHAVVQRRRLEEGRSPLPRIERPRHSKYNYHASSSLAPQGTNHLRRMQSDFSESEQVAGLFTWTYGVGRHPSGRLSLWIRVPA